MKKSTRFLACTVLAAALVVPATAALAGTSYASFNATTPPFQQGMLASSQTKTTASKAGNLSISSVASGYQVNARQCRLDVYRSDVNYRVSCGTERFHLEKGDAVTLPSKSLVGAGKRAYLELHTSVWTFDSVVNKGSWRSN